MALSFFYTDENQPFFIRLSMATGALGRITLADVARRHRTQFPSHTPHPNGDRDKTEVQTVVMGPFRDESEALKVSYSFGNCLDVFFPSDYPSTRTRTYRMGTPETIGIVPQSSSASEMTQHTVGINFFFNVLSLN